MKNQKILFVLCLSFYGLVLSCSKSYNDVPGGSTYSSMDDVFSSLRVQPKIDTIDAAAGGTFYGSSGTRYIFAANCFQTASGAAVTGKVQISTSEYLQKGDMLFSKMLPISNNEPLLSGGEINVSATQNGQTLSLKTGSVFQANIPVTGTLPGNLTFFSGQQNQDTTQVKTNWVQNPLGTVEIVTTPDSLAALANPDSLGIISDSLRQCNADQFITPLPVFQTFTVTAQVNGATLNVSDHVYGYTFYDTYKAEWPLGLIGSYANGVFTEMHVPTIPVHFVIFSLVNGRFYGGIGSATPVTGQNYTVTLTAVDAATFKEQVNKL